MEQLKGKPESADKKAAEQLVNSQMGNEPVNFSISPQIGARLLE